MSSPQQTIHVDPTPPAVESQPLPDTTTILTLGAIVAVVCWGIIQGVKLLVDGYLKTVETKSPFWYNGLLRISALCIGAAIGTALYGSLGGIGSGFPWGTSIGAGSGALCTLIVAAVKRKIRAK